MDNRIFNINGTGQNSLRKALELAFDQVKSKADGYIINPEKGFILVKYNDDHSIPFPIPLDSESVAPIVWHWLQKDPQITLNNWDRDFNHDGHNSKGWRVYCEDWGHIKVKNYEYRNVIVAITPAYMWHGK